MKPLLNLSHTFEDNINNGPIFDGAIPERILQPKQLWHSLFDYKVASKIGVPACSITKRKHLVLLSKLGFDVLTYKTIRTHAKVAHPTPTLCRVSCTRQLTNADVDTKIIACKDSEQHGLDIAAACSVGNPSFGQEQTQQDIAFVRTSIQEGQLLIVSVYGEGATQQEMIQDYARAAQLVVDAGAQAIELNLSCPNIIGGKFLYLDPQGVAATVSEVVKVVGTIPVLIKVGIFEDQQTLQDVLVSGAKSGMRGICAINAVKMKVENSDGLPTFDKRTYGGVSGNPIRTLALETIYNIHNINKKEKLGLTILGTGGVVLPEHFNDFFAVGADVAMSGAGTIWNPYLAHEYHLNHALHDIKQEVVNEL